MIKNVGAGLLANAVFQSYMYQLTLCFREQARSHIWISLSERGGQGLIPVRDRAKTPGYPAWTAPH